MSRRSRRACSEPAASAAPAVRQTSSPTQHCAAGGNLATLPAAVGVTLRRCCRVTQRPQHPLTAHMTAGAVLTTLAEDGVGTNGHPVAAPPNLALFAGKFKTSAKVDRTGAVLLGAAPRTPDRRTNRDCPHAVASRAAAAPAAHHPPSPGCVAHAGCVDSDIAVQRPQQLAQGKDGRHDAEPLVEAVAAGHGRHWRGHYGPDRAGGRPRASSHRHGGCAPPGRGRRYSHSGDHATVRPPPVPGLAATACRTAKAARC